MSIRKNRRTRLAGRLHLPNVGAAVQRGKHCFVEGFEKTITETR